MAETKIEVATSRRRDWCAGPFAAAPRDGDKKQARQRINVEVRTGRRVHPNNLPCTSCGHVWKHGEKRHEYDHHLGYAAEHHFDVQVRCTKCHHAKDSPKANQTHCIKGHGFTEENTYRATNGTRHCRACLKEYERRRGPRGSDHWAKVNAKRRTKRSG